MSKAAEATEKSTYELLLILDPDKKDDAKKKVFSLLDEQGVEVDNEDVWGLKTLAYPIKKKMQGRYVLLNISVDDKSKLAAINKELNMLEDVLRFMIIAPRG